MDVTRINLVGLSTVSLPLSVAQPSDPYISKSVDGLGPPEFDVSITPSAIQGGFYQGRRPLNRQLVFHIGLTPNFKLNQTASTLREALYELLAPEEQDESIDVEFLYGPDIVAQTKGWVSGIEPVLFAKEPEVQVTIDCDWPYLEGPSVLDVTPKLFTNFDIENVGSARAGFEVSVTMTAPQTTWYMQLGKSRFRADYPFLKNDIITFNTRPGTRSVTLTRGTTVTDLLFALNPGMVWLTLHARTNRFTTNVQTFTWNYFRYRPQYQGV